MSINIKTAREISNDVNQDVGRTLGKLIAEQQWVSFNWLKERIQQEIDSVNKWKLVDHSYQSGLNQVLEMLNHEQKG
jgi:hypothetical protein